MENIQYEQTLIDLLGLTLVGPDGSNRWIILDDNQQQVGFIQKKKIRNYLPDGFGYNMEINSPTIEYHCTRELITERDYYKFKVKKDGKTTAFVEITLSETPGITIRSEEYGFMNFTVTDEKLRLNYNTKTKHFNTEETIIVEVDSTEVSQIHKGKKYFYQIAYCDKKQTLTLANRNVARLYVEQTDKDNPDQITITTTTWKNGKKINSSDVHATGTISEAIKQHEDGIKDFSHFRYLINQILPFKSEVITTLLTQRGLNEYPFTLFIPEYDFGTDLSIYDVVHDISDGVKLGIRDSIEILGNTYAHGDVIYKNGEIHNFDHIISNSTNGIDCPEFYSWNKDYIFKCCNQGYWNMEPDDITVEKAFDINNKCIISSCDKTKEIYASYQKTKNLKHN